MIIQQIDEELSRCCRLIEEKIGRGSGKNWSTLDFEQLGEQIAEQTGVLLSVTTLKRIWNRVKYNSTPTSTTLNALAAFLGYQSWQDFQYAPVRKPAVTTAVETSYPEAVPLSKPPKRSNRAWALALGIVLIAALAGAFMFFRNHDSTPPLSPDHFSFSSKPVTRGIPNSVVFRYDARAATTDSVFIQQSWDSLRRQLVPVNGHEHSSIYYYPGYYRAKLVVGQQIVKEHDLVIPSDGWVAAVQQEPVPVYFTPREFINNGALHLPVALLQQQNTAMQSRPPVIYYGNIHDSTGLMSDNFVFHTKIRSDFSLGAAACQRIVITINCKNDMFSFCLCAKGCVGNIGLYLGGKRVRSTETDLSAFGCDLSRWVQVTCEVRNKQVQILIDGKKAYETTFPNAATEVIGVQYRFEGAGSVDDVRLAHLNGASVLEDHFDSPQPPSP